MNGNSNCRLIVNADDFGLSDGVNRGIIEAHVNGIVTSTSLMVRQPAARAAVELANHHVDLDVGLHLDFAEWAYRGGEWIELYRFVDVEDPRAVTCEIERQLELFERLLKRPPTHLDSHQHVHRRPQLIDGVNSIAAKVGVPLRFDGTAQYHGDFYGQTGEGAPNAEAILPDALHRLIISLGPGLHEICCHPGYADELNTMYRTERAIEIRSLCSPLVRQAIREHGVMLTRFDRSEFS